MRDQISTIGQSEPRSYIYINVSDVFKYNFVIFGFFNLSGSTQYTHNVGKQIFASTRQQPRFSTCI